MRGRHEFTAALRRGRRAGQELLVLHLHVPLREADDPAPAKAGFVVGRPVGGAVVRNLVRRRLRHLVRDRL
ncbi:MAG: ribonuclease P protein component, partial [Actinomycetota bacterium]